MVNKHCYIKYLLVLAIPFILLVIILTPKSKEDEIVSWAIGDIDGDSNDELLIIRGLGQLEETGDRYGNTLEIYKEYTLEDNKPLVNAEPTYSFDLTDLMPLKVQVGDINGDGLKEIGICVYKEAKFHQTMAKRPFFYDLEDGELIPIWLGSRLARPFDDYILRDIDSDGVEEIISIEQQEDESRIIVAYEWKGFGFEVSALSGSFEGTLAFEVSSIPDEVLIKHTSEGIETVYRVLTENDELKTYLLQ